MIPKHVFTNHCVNLDELLQAADLDQMIKIVDRQGKSELAKMRVDFAKYKDYEKDKSSSVYFGMFVEWLAGHFLDYFGHMYNVEGVKMHDVEGSSVRDLGVDGVARTMKEAKGNEFIKTRRKPVQGSPVYIQVKGTHNRSKMFQANDGTRLPNFLTHAQMLAMKAQKSYQARYILFTTGAGVHYTLNEMSGDLIEVVPYKEIKHRVDNNVVFLNRMRLEVGLPELPMNDSPVDYGAPVFTAEELVAAEQHEKNIQKVLDSDPA
jgi:hypothetical protein